MEHHSDASANRVRILVVEDDAAVRRSLQLLLAAQGYDVRAYPSGVGLARDPEALRSDCLVADLVLPESDGIELLKELNMAGWKGRSILISGYLTSEGEDRALQEGFDAVFAKPLAEAALTSCVSRLVMLGDVKRTH